MRCYSCGKQGHISMHCPQKVSDTLDTGWVSDTLLDTGCSRTMVHADLVQKHKIIPGEATTVKCIHGDISMHCPQKVSDTLDTGWVSDTLLDTGCSRTMVHAESQTRWTRAGSQTHCWTRAALGLWYMLT